MAGGSGTRLYPVTKVLNKHLLPIYNKPLIYYSISTLLLSGIRDIMIITNSESIDSFRDLFGDGSQLGIKISYAIQDEPNGIAEAFLISEEFIKDHRVMLNLGDNILIGNNLQNKLNDSKNSNFGCSIMGVRVNNPQDYGVAKLDHDGRIEKIVEKPNDFISDVAIIGTYFFDENVTEKTKQLAYSCIKKN